MTVQRKANPEPPRPTLFMIQRAYERSGGKSAYIVNGDTREIEMHRNGDHWASFEDVF